jgi:hypothetical protein
MAAAAKIERLLVPESLALRDGARAQVRDGALELSDARGRLLFRYVDGHAEVFAPEGDVTLAAPNGKVVLRSGRDVEVEAAGKVTIAAQTLAQRVETYELAAGRIYEKARDAFRDVSGLVQTRVGRARTLVSDVYALYSRRTVMVSKNETSVDGERILIG